MVEPVSVTGDAVGLIGQASRVIFWAAAPLLRALGITPEPDLPISIMMTTNDPMPGTAAVIARVNVVRRRWPGSINPVPDCRVVLHLRPARGGEEKHMYGVWMGVNPVVSLTQTLREGNPFYSIPLLFYADRPIKFEIGPGHFPVGKVLLSTWTMMESSQWTEPVTVEPGEHWLTMELMAGTLRKAQLTLLVSVSEIARFVAIESSDAYPRNRFRVVMELRR